MEEDFDFREGMMKLSAMYVATFQKNPEATLQMFCNTTVPLEVMQSCYKYLTNEKFLTKIEDIEEADKVKLWNQAKETCPSADKVKATKLCRCIWLINFILEK